MRILASLLSLFLLVGCEDIYDIIPAPQVKYTDSMSDDSGATNYSIDGMTTLCADNPIAVLCAGNELEGKLDFKTVYAIDVQLRGRFIYNSDWSLYHIADLWQNWVISGDCEDYALTESELLSRFGQSGAQMRLILLKISTVFGNVGHAMLAVHTSDKGWVVIGVNPEERPSPGAEHRFYLPSHVYRPMVEISMDGSKHITAFPGFTVKGTLILENE